MRELRSRMKRDQMNSAVVSGDIVRLNVSTATNPNAVMICDIGDFERWRDESNFGRIRAVQDKHHSYPIAALSVNIGGKWKNMYFHRLVRSDLALTGRPIDHIRKEFDDIDQGLDNRKVNLRDGSGGINQWNRKRPSTNTSGFRGVSWNRTTKKWQARIGVNNTSKSLGLFNTPQDASERYEVACSRRMEGLSLVEL